MNHGNVSLAGICVWGKGIKQGYLGEPGSAQAAPESALGRGAPRRGRHTGSRALCWEFTRWGYLNQQPLVVDGLSLFPWRGHTPS